MKRFQRFVFWLLISVLVSCVPPEISPAVNAEATIADIETRTPTAHIPTATGTSTIIPSPFPTLPVLPILPNGNSQGPENYHLAILTANQANEALARAEQSIFALANDQSVFKVDSSYYRAAWYAAWDALIHFPNDPRAEIWGWKTARYMALGGEVDESVVAYEKLIASLLNIGRASVQELPNHVLLGNNQDMLFMPYFVGETRPITVPNTAQGFIITIGNLNHPDSPLAACFLIIGDAGKYSVFFLQHSFHIYGYSIMSRDTVECYPKDVTDDGIDEIITDQYRGGHVGTYTFQVFDTTSLPPKIIPFNSGYGKSTDYWNGYLIAFPEINGKTQIEFQNSDLQGCENQVEKFKWSGNSIELIEKEIQYKPTQSNFEFCAEGFLYHSRELDPIEASNKFLDKVIGTYKPHIGENKMDLLEEFRIQKGLNFAFAGDVTTTRSLLSEIVKFPFTDESIWIEPLQEFLAAYQRPMDLYKACAFLTSCTPYRDYNGPGTCIETQLCNPTSALRYVLANEFSALPISDLTSALKRDGVIVLAEGWLDFNLDTNDDLWFTIPDEDGDPILWITVENGSRNSTHYVGYNELDTPKPAFRVETTPSGHILVDYGGYEGVKFELIHDPAIDNFEVIQVEPEDETLKAIQEDLANFKELRKLLFTGNEAKPLYNQLAAIDGKYPECPFEYYENKYQSPIASYDCASFYYTLAFSAELSGDENDAVKRYYQVWILYPDSPFALLARLKLEQ